MALEPLPIPNAEHEAYAQSLREKYEPFRKILGITSDPIIMYERHPRSGAIVFAFANDFARHDFCGILGVTEEQLEAAIGISINEGIMKQPISSRFRDDLALVFENGGEAIYQIPLDNRKSQYLMEYKVAEAERGIDGKVLSVVTSFRDVTERVRMLQENMALKEHAQKMVLTFAHDIGNSLASLSLTNYLLGKVVMSSIPEGTARDSALAQLKKAKAAAGNITHMAQTLLTQEMLEHGAFPECAPQPVDLNTFCEEIIGAHRDIDTRNHTYDLDIQLDGPVMVDPKYIMHILNNLVSNAAKYSPPGSRVLISGRAVEGKLDLAVTDSGEGISTENMAKLFQPFQRFSTDPHIKGTGVGLHISGAMAAAHGGRISVASEQGKGSTFTLEVPILQQEP